MTLLIFFVFLNIHSISHIYSLLVAVRRNTLVSLLETTITKDSVRYEEHFQARYWVINIDSMLIFIVSMDSFMLHKMIDTAGCKELFSLLLFASLLLFETQFKISIFLFVTGGGGYI